MTGIDGETYLWGIFRHVKNKEFSHNVTQAVTYSNNCTSAGLPSSRHPSSWHGTTSKDQMLSRIDSRGKVPTITVGGDSPIASKPHKVRPTCHDPRRSVVRINTPPGFLQSNSRDSNHMKSSIFKVPEVPPGFTKFRPPGLSKLHSQYPSSSPQTSCKNPMLSTVNHGHRELSTTVGGYPPTASTQYELRPKYDQV